MLATLRANIAATVLGVMALLFALGFIVQSVRLHGFLWIDGALDKAERLQRDNNELRAELKSISDKRNEQKAETSRRIDRAERGNREADKVARRIEQAPVPGQCRTPKEILGADL